MVISSLDKIDYILLTNGKRKAWANRYTKRVHPETMFHRISNVATILPPTYRHDAVEAIRGAILLTQLLKQLPARLPIKRLLLFGPLAGIAPSKGIEG
jgi:hypothetical protein